MSKISLEEIREILKQDNWKIITDKYTNLDTEMEFECDEGHKVYTTWKKIRNKRICPTCENNKLKAINKQIMTKSPKVKRILALDQASHITGYAIFDDNKLVTYGTFKTNQSDEIARCNSIKNWLISMINNWQLDMIGIEGVQLQDESSGNKMGVTVFQTLARLQGILMETCYAFKIPYEICPTNTWRHSCGVKGRSRADKKKSMQLLVKQWYDITVSDDEADAIGIGYHLTNILIKNTKIENWEI